MRRIQKELADLQARDATDLPQALSIELVNDNLYVWSVLLAGPEGSYYAGKEFPIHLEIPNEYPFKPPEVVFQSSCFHPNIDPSDGKICAQILGENWSPQIKLREVILIISQMLVEPTLDSPLNGEAAQLYSTDKNAFAARVQSS
eukprot:TRINITY_DN779_c0_g1_i1.p1 TRINITY_DN779_c0_g1~~TRINITY_DN779_c0_g1_i1.p1  ORF type:complete len:145 (+),score=45.07 TRINITY_DN779_c0_g1_i1:21-455(+)